MREVFTLEDKNTLFSSTRAMHDEIMTHIEVVDGAIRIEYGKLADNDYWKPYKKAVVTYYIDTDDGVLLNNRMPLTKITYLRYHDILKFGGREFIFAPLCDTEFGW